MNETWPSEKKGLNFAALLTEMKREDAYRMEGAACQDRDASHTPASNLNLCSPGKAEINVSLGKGRIAAAAAAAVRDRKKPYLSACCRRRRSAILTLRECASDKAALDAAPFACLPIKVTE